jgi:uncharacterized protein YmfQ (DUF2313 family)
MLDLSKLVPTKKYDEKHFWNMLVNLLPKGLIWLPRLFNDPIQWIDSSADGYSHEDSVSDPDVYVDSPWGEGASSNDLFANLLMVFAIELNRYDTRGVALEREAIPGLSDEMLSDWEEMAGVDGTGFTLEKRQQRVHLWITQNKGDMGLDELTQGANFFINYAANLGYTIVITDPAGTAFRVGISRVGDRLSGTELAYTWKVEGDWDAALQIIFEKIKPAHTIIWWV